MNNEDLELEKHISKTTPADSIQNIIHAVECNITIYMCLIPGLL